VESHTQAHALCVMCHITVLGPHFTLGLSLYALVLRYYSISEFFHTTPMQVLLLCSNYAYFIIEKRPRTRGGTNILPLASVSPCSSSLHCCYWWSECHCYHAGRCWLASL